MVHANAQSGLPDNIWAFGSGMTVWVVERPSASWGGVPGFTEPTGSWDVLGDSLLVIVDGLTGQFTWYTNAASGVKAVRHVDLGLAPRPIQGTERSRFVSDARSRLSQLNPRFARSARFGIPSHWSGISKVLLNVNGDTWFHFGSRRQTELRTTWFVLGREGAPLRSIEVPEGIEIKQVRGDLILAVGRTAFDSPVVLVYRLR